MDEHARVREPAAGPEPEVLLSETHPDANLVLSILRRDRKATAAFVQLHSDAIYAYVRRRLTPRVDLVDDVVQDVFVAALDGLAGFSGSSSLRAWLLGIARHKVENHYRQCLKQQVALADLEGDAEEPEQTQANHDEQLDGERRQQRVLRILAALPDVYRVVLLWRYWEKRSAREMAAATGKTEKAIERLLARARLEFRRRWNEEQA